MRRIFHTLMLIFLGACSPQMTKISTRNPDLFEKQEDPYSETPAPLRGPGNELYVKEPRLVIQPTTPENVTGSLASPDDDRLHLFTDSRPARVGRFIDVLVASAKARAASDTSGTKGETQSNKEEKGADKAADQKTDQLEEELLKSLPELAPAQKDSVHLAKQFKMQVMSKFPNGDILARVTRTSASPDQDEAFIAEARIPADRLTSGKPISTNDLVDVRIAENQGGNPIERRSTGWEDEYSLRLSGFSEAKSRAGMEIDEKRKELAEARDRLEQRIKSFAAEKKQFVAQRDELMKPSTQGNSGAKLAGDQASNPAQKSLAQSADAAKTDSSGGKMADNLSKMLGSGGESGDGKVAPAAQGTGGKSEKGS